MQVYNVINTNKQGKTKMSKLIKAYKKAPTAANRAKLQKYIAAHAMAICLLCELDLKFLKIHGFI